MAIARITRPRNVWMVSSEASPLRITGGLSRAVHGLAHALAQAGHRVNVLVPMHNQTLALTVRLRGETSGEIKLDHLKDRGIRFRGTTEKAWIFRIKIPLASDSTDFLTYYLIDNERCERFSNRKVYGYPDDAERYFFFDQVVAKLAKQSLADEEEGIDPPDVIHCHDWATAYVGYFLRHVLEKRLPIPLVYNIHNLEYATGFDMDAFYRLTGETDPWVYNWKGMEFHGHIDPHKTAFIFSDRIVTVSPSYAREILQTTGPDGRPNLYVGILREHQNELRGILNGIPPWYGVPHFFQEGVLPQDYGPENLEGKKAARQQLQERTGLEINPESMLLASTGRWAEQKGIKAMQEVLPEALGSMDLQFVTLGVETDGESYRNGFLKLRDRFPGRVAVLDFTGMSKTDEALEAQLLAGADGLLMPSYFEPSGLAQLYSLSLGTPVIANRTGGLADTIEDNVTGFFFDGVTPASIMFGIRKAYAAFKDDPEKWQAMTAAAMKKDFSWAVSAGLYSELYEEIIEFWAKT